MKLKKFLVWCLGLSLIFFVCGCSVKVESEENEDYVGEYTVKSYWLGAKGYPTILTFRSRIAELKMLGFFDEHLLKEYKIDNGYFVFVWQYRRETNISRLPIDKITIIPSEKKVDSFGPTIKFKFDINSIDEQKNPNHCINPRCVVLATIRMSEKDLEEKPILDFK